MEYGIVKSSLCTIYEEASEQMESKGQILSGIADEAAHGMIVKVTGEAQKDPSGRRFYPVRTFYHYTGYIPEEDLLGVTQEEAEAWERSDLRVTSGICVDVTSLPKVQGVCLISLFCGSLVRVLDWESETHGWARVCLADGRIGYMRNQYLTEKKFSQAGAWREELPQAEVEEEEFRRAVTETARTYLGVQYRWGGKTTAGIDCSGLVSASYMRCGILIYRDAKIAEGFPLREIPKERMKAGDLLFFPGHVAMYLGDGLYIHSTGKIGSGGVVYNSLDPDSPIYRQDLVDCMKAVGSIF